MILRLRLSETDEARVGVPPSGGVPLPAEAGTPAQAARPGITLLEVVIALAIFLFSVTAIWQLVVFGGDRALDVKYNSRASMLCQRELAKRTSGIEPLTSLSTTTLADEENWQCDVEVTDAEVYGLKKVKVTVKRDREDGRVTEMSLSQLVFDPASRGSTLDAPATTPSSSSAPPPTSEGTTGGTQAGGANAGGANAGGANNGANTGGGNRGGNAGGGAGKGPTQPARPPGGGAPGGSAPGGAAPGGTGTKGKGP